jgi:hypothetical protein
MSGASYAGMKLSSAAACLGLAMLSACRLFTGPEPRLIANIRIDKPALTVAEVLLVTVTVINRGDKEALASSPLSYDCESAFRVRSAAGLDLSLPPVVCTLQGYSQAHIPPGDSIVIQRHWMPTSANGPLPPGAYQLVGQAFGDGKELVSAPVDFTVTAGQASR